MTCERVIALSEKTTTQQSRTAKFYDDILNCRIRELMNGRETRTEDFAKAVGISSSAVRMWCTGYARPDIEKLPAICKYFNVSADWLLGLSETQSVKMEFREICKETGLSDHALINLKKLNEQLSNDEIKTSKLSAREQLWLINNFIEDLENVYEIADKANLYVNICSVVNEFEIADYDGTSAIEISKDGTAQFGMTFNFTYGQDTAEYLAYMCQKHFLDFIEGIRVPAYVLKETKQNHNRCVYTQAVSVCAHRPLAREIPSTLIKRFAFC
jgi:transcriptional regulator with XRE-family HTH domain